MSTSDTAVYWRSCAGLKHLLQSLAHPLVELAVQDVGPTVSLVTEFTCWRVGLPNLAESLIVNMEALGPHEQP